MHQIEANIAASLHCTFFKFYPIVCEAYNNILPTKVHFLRKKSINFISYKKHKCYWQQMMRAMLQVYCIECKCLSLAASPADLQWSKIQKSAILRILTASNVVLKSTFLELLSNWGATLIYTLIYNANIFFLKLQYFVNF